MSLTGMLWMDSCNIDFAREMVTSFGEDRFYHAIHRPMAGDATFGLAAKREARLIFLALGGSNQGWRNKCAELKLGYIPGSRDDYRETEMSPDEARTALCRTAFMIARHYKEYALKRPEMPPSIHARMVLDSQNEWTAKYVKFLEDFEN